MPHTYFYDCESPFFAKIVISSPHPTVTFNSVTLVYTQMSEHVRLKNAGREVPPYIAMTCLFVREGANWQRSSMLGVDVMALCPPELAPLIHEVASESRRYLPL